MNITPSGRAFESLDFQPPKGQKSGVNLHTNWFMQLFKKMFGLAFDVTLEGKVYCVNKRSLHKYLERSGVIRTGESLALQEMKEKVKGLFTVSKERASIKSLFGSLAELKKSTAQLVSDLRSQKKLVQRFPHIMSRYTQYEEKAQQLLDTCTDELKKNPGGSQESVPILLKITQEKEKIQQAYDTLLEARNQLDGEQRGFLNTVFTSLGFPVLPLSNDPLAFLNELAEKSSYTVRDISTEATPEQREVLEFFNQKVKECLLRDAQALRLNLPRGIKVESIQNKAAFLDALVAENAHAFVEVPRDAGVIQELAIAYNEKVQIALVRDTQSLGLRQPGGLTPTSIQNKTAFLDALVVENASTLIIVPSTPGPLQDLARAYNEKVRESVVRDAQAIGLGRGEWREGMDKEAFLQSLVRANQYSFPRTLSPSTPQQQKLLEEYVKKFKEGLCQDCLHIPLPRECAITRYDEQGIQEFLTQIARARNYASIPIPTSGNRRETALTQQYNGIFWGDVTSFLRLNMPKVQTSGRAAFLDALVAENNYTLTPVPREPGPLQDFAREYNAQVQAALARNMQAALVRDTQSLGLRLPRGVAPTSIQPKEAFLDALVAENAPTLIVLASTPGPLQDLARAYNAKVRESVVRDAQAIGLGREEWREETDKEAFLQRLVRANQYVFPGPLYVSNPRQQQLVVDYVTQFQTGICRDLLHIPLPPGCVIDRHDAQGIQDFLTQVARANNYAPLPIPSSGRERELIQHYNGTLERDVNSLLGLRLPRVQAGSREEFLDALVAENEYTLCIIPLAPGPLQDLARAYNAKVQDALVRDVQELGLKLPKRPDFRSNQILNRDVFLTEIALRNSYGQIQRGGLSPVLQRLVHLYETQAAPSRNAWLARSSLLGRIQKVTKRGLLQVLPYNTGRALGSGTSKQAYLINIHRPGAHVHDIDRIKEKALAVPAATRVKTEVETEIREECAISQALRTAHVPNVIFVRTVTRISSSGVVEGVGAFMELCRGGDLEGYLRRTPLLPQKEKMRLALELAQALAGMHRAGYCHCDLKSANVFIQVGNDGRPHIRLSDFGNTARSGTPGGYKSTYIAPEQYEYARQGQYIPALPESDMYVFGDILASLMGLPAPLLPNRVSWGDMHGSGEIGVLPSRPHPSRVSGAQAKFRTIYQSMAPYASRGEIETHMAHLFHTDPHQRPTAEQMVQVLERWMATH